VGNGWSQLQQTQAGYALQIPSRWRDFDPMVEQGAAGERAREVSPCYERLLSSLLESGTAQFTLLAIDTSLPKEVPVPASMAVGYSKAPLPVPISLLTGEFVREMNDIEGVTVTDSARIPDINGLGAVQLLLDIDGLCDAYGKAVPARGYQVYLVKGRDIYILTFIATDVRYPNELPVFERVAHSFQLQ
jgi:hypothetical protein